MDVETLAALGAIAQRHWGMFTTAEAGAVGITRPQLSRLAAGGAISRVAQGVYRLGGAPQPEHEQTYATWLALGGANHQPGEVPAVVAAGATAAAIHGIGDLYQGGFDFIVPRRKGTRLPDVRLRIRPLTPGEISFVNSMPALTIERTIADLVERRTDLTVVADALRDAVRSWRLVDPQALVDYLEPLARKHGFTDGELFSEFLYELAHVSPPTRAAT